MAIPFIQVIQDSVSIPKSKLKLIRKGKIATSNNIKEMLVDKALFLAFVKISYLSEEGLESADIDFIVEQLGVARDLAYQNFKMDRQCS